MYCGHFFLIKSFGPQGCGGPIVPTLNIFPPPFSLPFPFLLCLSAYLPPHRKSPILILVRYSTALCPLLPLPHLAHVPMPVAHAMISHCSEEMAEMAEMTGEVRCRGEETIQRILFIVMKTNFRLTVLLPYANKIAVEHWCARDLISSLYRFILYI